MHCTLQIFPRLKERDPYRRLGVSREASYEEVQVRQTLCLCLVYSSVAVSAGAWLHGCMASYEEVQVRQMWGTELVALEGWCMWHLCFAGGVV